MISILLLEDNEVLSRHLERTLSDWHFSADVLVCQSNAEAAEIIATNHIGLLLADLNVSDGDGVDTIRLFSKANPDGVTIIMSGISEPERIIRAIKSGAVGYLHKSDTSLQLIASIEKALAGQSPISAEIAVVLFTSLQHEETTGASEASSEILTSRETEVINLVARGLSNAEIAKTLSISKNTLPVHIRNIYRKLQTNNRTEAVFEARNLGIL